MYWGKTTSQVEKRYFLYISSTKTNIHVKCCHSFHEGLGLCRADHVGSKGQRLRGIKVFITLHVTCSLVCLCFLSFVSNKNLGDWSFSLTWLLWNFKTPVGLTCCTLTILKWAADSSLRVSQQNQGNTWNKRDPTQAKGFDELWQLSD